MFTFISVHSNSILLATSFKCVGEQLNLLRKGNVFRAVNYWNWNGNNNRLRLRFYSQQSQSQSIKLKGPVLKLSSNSERFLSIAKGGCNFGKMAEAQESSGSVNANATGNGERSKCVFCKIVDGKEANEIYYQDDEIVVFQDIKPAAKYHLLVVTREHIKDCKSLGPAQLGLVDRLVQIGNQVLQEQMQKDGGSPDQVQKLLGFHWPPFHMISHLHLHVIAPSDQMGFLAKAIFKPGIWFVTPEYVRERIEKMGAGGGT